MADYTVADLVAEFLQRVGVETAFGVVSVHNVPMLDAIATRNAVRFIMTRGEAGAAHMADGYARVTDGLGVVFSSTGPGAANAVGGLVEAQIALSPVLHMTGLGTARHLDRDAGCVHDVKDQLGMMASVCKGAWRVRAPSDALGILIEAATTALTWPTGPVSIEIPVDLQRAKIDRPAMLDHLRLPIPGPVVPTGADLDRVADRLAAAKRPMIWAGRGALAARAELEALMELGVGLVTSLNARAAVPEDHPMSFGSLSGIGIVAVERFYESVDLMLVAGSRLRGHETAEFNAPLPKTMIQIDTDPRVLGRTYAMADTVLGDPKLVLAGLLERIRGRMSVEAGYAEEVRALKQEAQAAYLASLGPYATFSEQLRAVMPHDAVWARDVTQNNSTWGNRLFPLADPKLSVFPLGAGIGQGLSLGIGAAAGAPGRKTVIMTGDGGFYLNLGELWTPIQERLDTTIVVMNDGGYGVIRHIQDAQAGGRRHFETLAAPDLSELARIADLPFWRASAPEHFGTCVAEALAIDGPSMVEVDMSVIGDHPPYYPFGPKLGA